MSSCVCRGGVACFRWWLGGNCYHRRCVAACRRRVGGLWSQNPPNGCSKCSPPRWNAGDMGCLGCSGPRFGRGCVSVWCCGVCEGGAGGVSVGEAVADVWGGVVAGGVACFRWWLGGIATIGAALRRVVGVSGVYGRKTPRGCLEGPGPCARGGVYGCKSPRVVAQSAVHLGEMRVTWGVWGVVDHGLGVAVRGEAFSAGRRVGYVGPQCVLPG